MSSAQQAPSDAAGRGAQFWWVWEQTRLCALAGLIPQVNPLSVPFWLTPWQMQLLVLFLFHYQCGGAHFPQHKALMPFSIRGLALADWANTGAAGGHSHFIEWHHWTHRRQEGEGHRRIADIMHRGDMRALLVELQWCMPVHGRREDSPPYQPYYCHRMMELDRPLGPHGGPHGPFRR